MIGIGVQMGGPEQKDTLVRSTLMKAMNAAVKVREPNYNDGTEAWVNPVFIVPGSIWRPEFSGYDLGHFSKTAKGLVVKIAVPQSVAEGKEVQQFIVKSLREAVRLASAYFSSKDIIFSTSKA